MVCTLDLRITVPDAMQHANLSHLVTRAPSADYQHAISGISPDSKLSEGHDLTSCSIEWFELIWMFGLLKVWMLECMFNVLNIYCHGIRPTRKLQFSLSCRAIAAP